MLDFHDFVRSRLETQDDDAITREVLAADVSIYDVILQEVRHVRRAETRRREAAAFRRVVSGSNGSTGTGPDDRAALLEEKFALGDGRWVTWGEATVADHAERIAYLTKLRDGVQETIDRHQSVIDVLRTEGATRLSELTDGVEVLV